jgi:hypothetical protein
VVETEKIAAPLRRLGGLSAATALVAGGTTGLFLWVTASWPSASSNDAWAYTAWGQALARGEQLVYNLGTTPKPLASVLAAFVSPLPPARAWAVVVALSLGMVVAGLLAAGYRGAGPLGAVVAPAAFVLAAALEPVIWFSLVDALTAALVVCAVALQGRARIVPLVLAGLLRPEAWAASALAGYVEVGGSRLRRALGAAVAGALPIVLWLVLDLLLAGDALATQRFREGAGPDLAERTSQGVLEGLDLLRKAIVAESGALFALVGAVGLLAHGWRSYRRGEFPFPLALALVWLAGLFAETVYGIELNPRYLLPVVAILALGWGLLVGASVTFVSARRAGWPWVAAATALAATAVAVMRMDFGLPAERSRNHSLAVSRSAPTVETVLDCGRLGFVGRRRVAGTMSRLSALTRTSSGRFERAESQPPSRYAGVLAVRGVERRQLPAWPIRRTPLGPLAVDPGCHEDAG